jgi:hypothetical protein
VGSRKLGPFLPLGLGSGVFFFLLGACLFFLGVCSSAGWHGMGHGINELSRCYEKRTRTGRWMLDGD